jgi:hypothetical protein
MAAWVEVAMDECVSGKEVLGLIVQISALSLLGVGKQVALCHAVASQLVSHDHPRHIVQSLQQAPEEALGGFGISALLNEDVEHNAVLIHAAPKIMPYALDPDEHLVQVPLVPGPWPSAAQAVGKAPA